MKLVALTFTNWNEISQLAWIYKYTWLQLFISVYDINHNKILRFSNDSNLKIKWIILSYICNIYIDFMNQCLINLHLTQTYWYRFVFICVVIKKLNL